MRTGLKILRIKHHLTMQQLAKKLGVSYSTYNLIEKGERKGSTEFWERIQTLFNLTDAEMWQLYANKEYAVNPKVGVETREV